jgi:hypothetical protein
MEENKLQAVLSGKFNPTRELYLNIAKQLRDKFVELKEYDELDEKLIAFFRDIIQAKTLKYITPEKLATYSQFNLPKYVQDKCAVPTNQANKKVQFALVVQKLNYFKSNSLSQELYRKTLTDDEGDYF